ncbi:prokineticin-2 [Rhinatrema bivittatum]|uniref:prokineticin-2 n=1 Tax=Rhinatrema bivittatum TaxID=194408 RepID=UPI00112919CD|nr:prokineticin-2 [Rhinatrema bivittatum]
MRTPSRRRAPLLPAAAAASLLLLLLLLLLPAGEGAIITGACEKDSQCGGGMCCAVSLWIQSVRICKPMSIVGEECHPLSHKVPFPGKRKHHTCPCLPHLNCVKILENKYRCL